MTPLPEDEARHALVRVMQRMHASGLNRGTSGNASIRIESGMLVTPSGVPPEDLTPDSMVVVHKDGAIVTGKYKPSSEYQMHHHILQARADAQAVVHCHSRYATILACCNRPVLPIHYMILVARAATIPVAPYATFGSEQLAKSVIETMGSGSACLMAHHGQVAIGPSWQQALAIAEEVEEQAAITHGALLIGGAPTLTPENLAATIKQFQSYGQTK